MKVKINKVIPFRQNMSKKMIKGQPFIVNKVPYLFLANKLQQKNFTGFPAYFQFIFTFPDPTVEYQYGRIQIALQMSDFKQIVQKKSQRFEDIKRGQNTRDFIFNYIPTRKGTYRIKLQIYYKSKNYSHTNSHNHQSQQKRQMMEQMIKYEDPFELSQLFITNDNTNSITFPFFVQHTIQNKITDEQVQFKISFLSENFDAKFINDKNQFKLKTNQIYNSLLSIKPKDVRKLFSEKALTIGQLCIKYGEKGQTRKRISLTSNNKLIFFKVTTVQKNIPKKDIVLVTVRFEKIYNLNFGLGDISIVINENLMEGVKIVKASKQKINLEHKLYDQVVFSIICLKSGFFCLKGFTLYTSDKRTVNYVNDLTLFVQNQQQNKAPVFENTSVIQLSNLDEESLI